MTRFFTRDRIVAIVLFLCTLAWGWCALRLPPAYVKGVPGPAFFPLAIFVALGVLSVILFIQSGDPEKQDREKILTVRQAAVFALMFLYVLLVPVLGFAPGTFAAVSAIMLFTGQATLRSTFLTAISVSVLLYLFFKVFLQIPLPAGIWFS